MLSDELNSILHEMNVKLGLVEPKMDFSEEIKTGFSNDLSKMLFNYSEKGRLDEVKWCVANGANVHAGDNYALRSASRGGHLKVVQLLLEAGADVHANDDQALKWACECEHSEVVYLLRKYM